MSRIGKLPVPVPKGVTVTKNNDGIEVKGPKGTLARVLHPAVEVTIGEDQVVVSPRDESRLARALWGTTRTLVNNMVVGVTSGFSKGLEIVGVGYRVEQKGRTLVFSLGYSHPVEFDLPEGINATLDKQNKVVLDGIDKELLGQTAATVRSFRPPEPYKGKGVRYVGEQVRRKVGKAGAGR